MKQILFSFFLVFLPVFSQTNDDKFHICFFELDNTTTSKNFKSRIADSKQTKIDLCKKKQEFKSANTVVHCYQPQIGKGEHGVSGFERMIQEVSQSGDKCDGLVVSGHHTGDWYGGTGKIKLKDMEELSCNPKYRDWFSNIKALWLDGCNTVTDNLIESGTAHIPSPDSETVRVVGKENPVDKIDRWAIANTSQAYTASLDKNTPLSSRYLRMFPHTQVYGFNGAAPEGKDKGQWVSFIADHLSHIGLALQAEKDQIKQTGQKDQIKQALAAILSSDPCDEEKLAAWETASWDNIKTEAIEQQDYETAYKLGCHLILAKQILDNPSSEKNQKALAEHIKSLIEKGDVKNKGQLLTLANEILRNPSSDKAVQLAKEALLSSLDEITNRDKNVTEEDKTYTHLLFNNIYDTWKTAQKYETRDNAFYKEVQTRLKADNFKVSLKERIESHQTASLRKGDYIKFYMEVNSLKLSNAPGFIAKGINDLAQTAEGVFKDLKSPRQSQLPIESRRALAVSVVDQLFQYDLLTEGQIKSFLANQTLFPKKRANPFVTEVQVNLYLSDETNEKKFISALKTGKKHALRGPILRSLSRKYFQNPPANLMALQEVADGINLDDYSEDNSDVMIFFNVMHAQLSRYTQEQREDFIVQYSQKSNKNLEELLLWYAGTNFSPDRNKEICRRLSSNQAQTSHLSYVCKG